MLNRTSVSSTARPKVHRAGIRKFLSGLLIALGGVCLLVVVFPAIKFYVYRLVYPEPHLLSPVDNSLYPAPIIIGGSLDSDSGRFGQASNWFVKTIPLPSPAASPVSFFRLSIPDIGLTDVPIQVNGQDLKKNAIHYPGTSLPGDFGNSVVFGHSALSQFFRPNDPLTIFNPLLKAKVGSLINIRFNNFDYSYRISKITEVNPDQIEVLAQNYSNREITLITCVPLGTYWHRLVVRAELIK